MSEVTKLTDRLWVRRSEHGESYYFYCLGCKELHGLRTKSLVGGLVQLLGHGWVM